MKNYLKNLIALVISLGFMTSAFAQVVTQLPTFIAPNAVTDLGNGPMELKVLQGSAFISTAQGSGVGSTSGSSTTLTLTATPATPPCVGCIISGAGITSGTTVAAFNGTTTITLSAAMTVSASTPLAWGAACPTGSLNAPAIAVSFGQTGGDLPLYTQARVCASGQSVLGASALPFPIGAH